MLLHPKTTEKGQGLVEYTLIFLLVVIILVVLVAVIGPQIATMFSNVVAILN